METFIWTADRAVSYAAMKHHRDTVDARIAKASNRAKYSLEIPTEKKPRDIIGQVLFPMVYKSDRRKHSHRCRCCWTIIEPGQNVLCLRHKDKGTWMLHDACGHIPHTEGNSWRDAFKAWAVGRLKALGYSEKVLEKAHPAEMVIFRRMSLCAAAALAEVEALRAACINTGSQA